MNQKNLGWGLALVGVILVGISLAADPLGLGAQPQTIGWKQWLGTAVGAGLLLVGLWWRQRSSTRREG